MAIDRCVSNLMQVRSVLVDGGYTGEPFAQSIEEKLGATVQVAKRNELYTFTVIPATLGGRALLRMVRKMPTIMEKLRAQAQYQLTVYPFGISRFVAQKIVNRLLGRSRPNPVIRHDVRKAFFKFKYWLFYQII